MEKKLIFKKKRLSGNTIRRLEKMLEEAEKGTFTEEVYDESQLSRLETRWKRYLGAAAVSKRRLAGEQQGIKTLISDISHQTKTPLSNILLYAQILQEKERDPDLTEIVNNIEAQAEKLNFLITSLVNISRLESRMLTLAPKKQAIRPMLEAAVLAQEKAAEQKGIEIVLENGDAAACFDRKWTQEAVENLIDNAVKYSPSGSRIQIGLTEYELFAAIHIRDQGIGVREEEQAQIFERFYRGKEVQEEKGVGIGLYLVRQIAAQQSGYVKLKSEYGKGSVFSFYLSKSGD